MGLEASQLAPIDDKEGQLPILPPEEKKLLEVQTNDLREIVPQKTQKQLT